jgi:hypothetical protein
MVWLVISRGSPKVPTRAYFAISTRQLGVAEEIATVEAIAADIVVGTLKHQFDVGIAVECNCFTHALQRLDIELFVAGNCRKQEAREEKIFYVFHCQFL